MPHTPEDPTLIAFRNQLILLLDATAAQADAAAFSGCLDALLDAWLNEMRQAAGADVLVVMHALVAGLARAGIQSGMVQTGPEAVVAAHADTKARMN
jgi:hypothetical protein